MNIILNNIIKINDILISGIKLYSFQLFKMDVPLKRLKRGEFYKAGKVRTHVIVYNHINILMCLMYQRS